MMDFEPLERYFLGRRPQAVQPLEMQFNGLRGDVSAGLNNEDLAARLDNLFRQVESLVAELETQPAGRFGSAFLASFITIVREGVEVILIVTMLLALVGKATGAAGLGAYRGGQPAHAGPESTESDVARGRTASRRRGCGPSGGCCRRGPGKHRDRHRPECLDRQGAGAARETLEGFVMLAAAAVLFYVSYWLVSRFEAKRWTDYLGPARPPRCRAGRPGYARAHGVSGGLSRRGRDLAHVSGHAGKRGPDP